MREIIFRGKSVNDGRWVFGNLSDYGDCKTIATVKDCSIIDSCEVIPETVGQYTGLKDLHGTRIFEGDVVRLQNLKRLYEVYWNKKEARYKARNGGCVSPLCNGYNVFVEEVVGNVFDNPELLKGSAKNE